MKLANMAALKAAALRLEGASPSERTIKKLFKDLQIQQEQINELKTVVSFLRKQNDTNCRKR